MIRNEKSEVRNLLAINVHPGVEIDNKKDEIKRGKDSLEQATGSVRVYNSPTCKSDKSQGDCEAEKSSTDVRKARNDKSAKGLPARARNYGKDLQYGVCLVLTLLLESDE